MDRARETIKKSVEKIWNKHQDAFSPGDLNGVLQAVGQVCLFAHPGIGTAFKIRGALMIGQGLAQVGSSVSTAKGSVSKDAKSTSSQPSSRSASRSASRSCLSSRRVTRNTSIPSPSTARALRT